MNGATDNQGAGSSGLKPAPIEQGYARKLWLGVGVFCIGEMLALVFGSGLLWYTGVWRNAVVQVGLGLPGVMSGLTMGWHIEIWLAMLSGEPILNDRDEIDSNAPFERGLAYLLPPLVATFGWIGIPAHSLWIPVATSGLSLLLFARIMHRIWSVWRNRPADL